MRCCPRNILSYRACIDLQNQAIRYKTYKYDFNNGQINEITIRHFAFGQAARSEKYTINNQGQTTEKKISIILADGSTKLIENIVYTYGANGLLSTENISEYSDNTSLTINTDRQFQYTADLKGNICRIIEISNGIRQENLFVYGQYNQVLEKKYYIDFNGNHYILERYTLRLDGKSIESKSVYTHKNGVMKQEEKVLYLYGQQTHNSNCIVEERLYHSVEAELFNTKLYVYDSNLPVSKPVSIIVCGLLDADGQALPNIVKHYEYNMFGLCTKETNGNGSSTTITYDMLNRISCQEKEGISKIYENDDVQNQVIETGCRGQQKNYKYDAFGNILQVSIVSSNDVILPVVKYVYNVQMQLENEIYFDLAGETVYSIVHKYDQLDRLIESKSVEKGYIESYLYDSVVETPQKTFYSAYSKKTVAELDTDIEISCTEKYLDAADRIILQFENGRKVEDNTYDLAGNCISCVGANGAITDTVYNYGGLPLKKTTFKGDHIFLETMEYDCLGNKIAHTDILGHTTVFSYDSNNRLLLIVSPKKGGMAITKNFYDSNGNIIKQELELGSRRKKTEFEYDELDRVICEKRFNSEEADGWTKTTFVYDNDNNIIQMETGTTSDTAGISKYYAYNCFNKAISEQDSMGHEKIIHYNSFGIPSFTVDKNGNRIDYEYDCWGNLITEVSRIPGDDAASITKSYEYSQDGKMTRAVITQTEGLSEISLSTEYFYDSDNNLSKQIDPSNIVKMYTHDDAGDRISMHMVALDEHSVDDPIDAFDMSLYYSYTPDKCLDHISRDSEFEAIIVKYQYDSLGNLVRVFYPESDTTVKYTYDDFNNKMSQLVLNGDIIRERELYEYSIDGLLLKKYVIHHDNALTAIEYDNLSLSAQQYDYYGLSVYDFDFNGTIHLLNREGPTNDYIIYDYDLQDRLICEKCSDEKATTYSYDSFENRAGMIQVDGQDIVETRYQYDQNNRLSKCIVDGVTTCYEYDREGNLLSESISDATNASYEYNGFGQMIVSA